MLRGVSLPRVDRWSAVFDNRADELAARDWHGFLCGFPEPNSPQPGPWRLSGISPVYYTPIMDIYADRTKSGTSGTTVYYRFRYVATDRS
jgi:hypothetical protein